MRKSFSLSQDLSFWSSKFINCGTHCSLLFLNSQVLRAFPILQIGKMEMHMPISEQSAFEPRGRAAQAMSLSCIGAEMDSALMDAVATCP